MNLHSELQRIWSQDRAAVRMVPVEKVFRGYVPDKYVNSEGEEKDLDAPFICMWSPDTDAPGGTSITIESVTVLQISAFATTAAEAEAIRNHARDLYEDAEMNFGGQTETFQDVSLGQAGELPPVDGLFEFFQRFNVETSITRPRRKRI